MKRREFALGTAAVALPAWLPLQAQAQAQSGKDYKELKKAVPTDAGAGKIEVLEFFSYGCVHCKNFEPIFEGWTKAAPKDVVVRLVHVGFNSSFEPLQRIFYALEAMGKVNQMQSKVFTALQTEKKRLDKSDVLFPWIADQGIDRAEFEKAYKSFGVATAIRKAAQLQEAYQVEGTPALGIAGKYYTDPTLTSGFDSMLKVANTLIAQERKKG